LQKQPGSLDRFGFEGGPAIESMHIVITWIDPVSLLGRWNETNPNEAVRAGDLIVAVNGIHHDTALMMSQLNNNHVTMLVRQNR